MATQRTNRTSLGETLRPADSLKTNRHNRAANPLLPDANPRCSSLLGTRRLSLSKSQASFTSAPNRATGLSQPSVADVRLRTLVVIPARDEEDSIAKVISELQKKGWLYIRVVDNGSIDRTAERARRAGAKVVSEPNRGYGAACWTGCQDLPADVDWLLFCNADHSEDLNALPAFASAAESHDFVLGERHSNRQGWQSLFPAQRFGNHLMRHLVSLGWGTRYRDFGPLRMIRRSSFDKLRLQDRWYGWTLEMQVRAIEENLRISEVPVKALPRTAGEPKISGTISGSIFAARAILSTLGQMWWRKHFPKKDSQPELAKAQTCVS